MRQFAVFAAMLMAYLVATVIADFPIYPIVIGGIFFATLIIMSAQQKMLFMLLIGAGLVGYHFAVVLADFPIWPAQTFGAACVIVCVISIARGRMAAAGATNG